MATIAGGNIKIDKCYNYGKIVNNNSTGTIEKCSAGGLIGYSYGGTLNVINSVNYGYVSSKDSHPYDGTGGIIGGNYNPIIEIYNTCNYGEIIGNQRGGGIIGAFTIADPAGIPKLVNVFNTGKVTLSTGSPAYGLIGATRVIDITETVSAILNCYYISTNTKAVGGCDIEVGTQYTELQLKSEEFVQSLNTYIDSNTDGIDTSNWLKWKYNSNSYPTF